MKDTQILVCAAAGSGKTTTLAERVKRMIGDGIDPMTICLITYTRAGAAAFRQKVGQKVGYTGTLHSLMLRVLKDQGSLTVIPEEQAEGLLKKVIKDTKFTGSQKDVVKILRSRVVEQGKATYSKDEITALQYQNTLRENGIIDYDSILTFGLHQLRKQNGMIKWNGKQLTHLFVDEVQDSSAIDHKIFRSINVHTRFHVGDDKQAIYSFRGARPDLMIEMWHSGAPKTHSLPTNYRSDTSIIDHANRLISWNVKQIHSKAVAHSDLSGITEVREFASAIDEMSWIASRIDEPNEAAILLRTNALARLYKGHMEAVGIPVRGASTKKLPEDWDRCRRTMAFVANPYNQWAARDYAFLVSGPDRARQMDAEAREKMTSINALFYKQEKITDVSDLMLRLKDGGISEECCRLVYDTWQIETLSDDWINDLIIKIHESAKEVVFMGDGIHVGTIHSAKGLEWDQVFLPAFENKIIPCGDLEEERRLAYVAFTRARHELYISWARKRALQWKPNYIPAPSRFIEESQHSADEQIAPEERHAAEPESQGQHAVGVQD